MTAGGELERLRLAARRYRTAKQQRLEVVALIVAAAEAGVAQRDIVDATGFTREHIRRIVQAHQAQEKE